MENNVLGGQTAKLSGSAVEHQTTSSLRREILRFAVPASLQVVLHQLFGLAGQVLVAGLGETDFVAVGLGAQLISLAFVFLSAVVAAASIRLARYAGAKDELGFSKTAAQIALLTLVMSIATAALISLCAPWALSLMGAAPEVAERGVFYIRLVAWSTPLMALTEMCNQTLRARGDARSPMIYGLVTLAANAILTYVIIYGVWVVPPMGLAGAGVAIIVARGMGFVLVCRVLLSPRHALRLRVEHLGRLEKELVGSLLWLALPIAGGQAIWLLGLLGYTRVNAALGTTVLAAASVIGQFEGICVLFSLGFAMACMTFVGQKLGQRDVAGARRVAAECLRLAFWISLVTGAVMGAFTLSLGTFYPRLEEQTLALAAVGLFVSGLIQPVKVGNMVLAVGVLRAGGDVRFATACETLIVPGIVCAWALGVPLGWGFLGVLAGRTVEELLKLATFSWRYASERWVHEVK